MGQSEYLSRGSRPIDEDIDSPEVYVPKPTRTRNISGNKTKLVSEETNQGIKNKNRNIPTANEYDGSDYSDEVSIPKQTKPRNFAGHETNPSLVEDGGEKTRLETDQSSNEKATFSKESSPGPNEKKKPVNKKPKVEDAPASEEGVEGRSRRRAAAAISFKEPPLNRKMRQGDEHSGSVYSDFVPKTKGGKGKGSKKK